MSAERRNAARREAARAVAAIGLGLPLVRTSIEDGAGVTTLDPGVVERWLAALPDAEARGRIDAYVVQIAAGIIADGEISRSANPASFLGRVKHLLASSMGDYRALLELAGRLGLHDYFESNEDGQYVHRALKRAKQLLTADGRAAWDRVTAALERSGSLAGAEVAALVAGEAR